MSGLIPSLSVALIAISAAACSLPMLLQKNLAAIEASTASITANSDVVKHSTSVTEEGIKSFEGLKGPMESVAGLAPSLEEVAALDQPMQAVAKLGDPMKNVATLAPPMREVARLERPMTRLADLQPSLDRVAVLGPSMDRLSQMRPSLDQVATLRDPMIQVASLRPELGAVADLRTPMNELTTLRQPLERVADLRQPLEQVAALGTVVEHPILIALLALVGLGLWGGDFRGSPSGPHERVGSGISPRVKIVLRWRIVGFDLPCKFNALVVLRNFHRYFIVLTQFAAYSPTALPM